MLDVNYRQNEARDYVGPPKWFKPTVCIAVILAVCAGVIWVAWPSIAKARRAAVRQEVRQSQNDQKQKYLGLPLTIDDLPLDKVLLVTPTRADISDGDTQYFIYGIFMGEGKDATIRAIISKERLPMNFKIILKPDGTRSVEPMGAY